MSLIDHLFNRLNGVYPNKWRANFRDLQAIEDWRTAWAEAFDDEGLKPADIALGLRNCRRMFDWPPSLTEFLRACRPWMAPEVAHQIAVEGMSARARGERGEWPHPAVYWAAVRVGSHDLLNVSFSSLRPRWEAAFADVLAKGRWADIPDPAPALPAPGAASLDRVQAARQIEQAGVAAVTGASRTDHRAWIARLQEREQRKETLPVAVKRMLTNAVGGEA